jgi:PhnB protein
MMTMTGIPAGFSTVTPTLSVVEAERLITFAKETFDAVETHRTTGSGGGIHSWLRVGDSMLMCFGAPARGPQRLHALHVYVPDTDAVYRRALEAGAESLYVPEDKPYGERQAGVKDPTGNLWFIATRFPGTPVLEGMRTVTPYLLANNALGLIEFLKQAFSAREEDVYKTPDGKVMHAALRVGDAVLELGDAQAMPANFYLYVPDADALYRQAVDAGAKAVVPLADQPWGDRGGAVEDAWGNSWFIATHLAGS